MKFNSGLNLKAFANEEAEKKYTVKDNVMNFINLAIKLSIMIVLMSVNILALSISINCNRGENILTRIGSALFAFLFGIVYLFVNYYSYRVLTLGKICEFNKNNILR